MCLHALLCVYMSLTNTSVKVKELEVKKEQRLKLKLLIIYNIYRMTQPIAKWTWLNLAVDCCRDYVTPIMLYT